MLGFPFLTFILTFFQSISRLPVTFFFRFCRIFVTFFRDFICIFITLFITFFYIRLSRSLISFSFFNTILFRSYVHTNPKSTGTPAPPHSAYFSAQFPCSWLHPVNTLPAGWRKMHRFPFHYIV